MKIIMGSSGGPYTYPKEQASIAWMLALGQHSQSMHPFFRIVDWSLDQGDATSVTWNKSKPLQTW